MLDRQSPKPLYVQLEELLKKQIENEDLKASFPIPSENELSKEYGLSRMTVRSVLTRLVQEGLLYRVPGKGTFVSQPKITGKPLYQMGIREQLEQMGYETSTKLIHVDKEMADDKIAKDLHLLPRTEVYVIERLRYVKNEPLSIHTSYIPTSLCPQLEAKDFEKEQLCNILEREYKITTTLFVETLESSSANNEEARLLSVRKGFPLLFLKDIMYMDDHVPYEYSKVLFRGDKLKIRLEFHKS